MTEREMFLEQVTCSVDGCWIWNGKCERQGYGWLFVRAKKMHAHRLAYELFVGVIPAGVFVCHHCDNPACVRPDHLFLGTARDNVADMHRKGRAVPRGKKKPKDQPNSQRPPVKTEGCPWVSAKPYPSFYPDRKQWKTGQRRSPVRPA